MEAETDESVPTLSSHHLPGANTSDSSPLTIESISPYSVETGQSEGDDSVSVYTRSVSPVHSILEADSGKSSRRRGKQGTSVAYGLAGLNVWAYV